VRQPLRDLLDECTAEDLQINPYLGEHTTIRIADFGPVIELLSKLNSVEIASKERARAESLAEAAKEELQVQVATKEEVERERNDIDGELRLAEFIFEALERSQGKPTEDDNARANKVVKEFEIAKDRARQIVKEAREKWGKSLSQTGRAVAYYKNHSFDRAIAEATQAIQLNPDDVVAYFIRAESYREKGDFDLAIADATEAIDIDPEYVHAYVTRATCYQSKNEFDRAISEATKAI
jgi:tetratricopeptide (TPR) repeat protein